MPTSVALGTHFETFVKSQVASGRYNNASEVVREGLRLLEDREAERRLSFERLRADVQAGAASGVGRPAHVVLDELEARYAALVKSGKSPGPRRREPAPRAG